MNTQPLLIAGIGNIFLGDDAFGVEVARELAKRRLPEGVGVWDFGINGIDLVYALMDGCDACILVDAVCRGQPAGTLSVIEPDIAAEAVTGSETCRSCAGGVAFEPHSLDPLAVLRLVAGSRGRCSKVLLVACDCGSRDREDFDPLTMSDAVRSAIEPAAALVEQLIPRMLARGDGLGPQTEAGHSLLTTGG